MYVCRDVSGHNNVFSNPYACQLNPLFSASALHSIIRLSSFLLAGKGRVCVRVCVGWLIGWGLSALNDHGKGVTPTIRNWCTRFQQTYGALDPTLSLFFFPCWLFPSFVFATSRQLKLTFFFSFFLSPLFTTYHSLLSWQNNTEENNSMMNFFPSE